MTILISTSVTSNPFNFFSFLIYMSFTIHKSFTKNDLIEICSDLKLPIVYSKSDTKHDIQSKIYDFFKEWMQYSFATNHYNIEVLMDLRLYLTNENPNKRLTSKEKDKIIFLSKKIIHYGANDYNLKYSDYDSEQEIMDDLYYIAKYGDILSVRKAVDCWNKQHGLKTKITPDISHKKKLELEKKKKYKMKDQGLKVSTGAFVVKFA